MQLQSKNMRVKVWASFWCASTYVVKHSHSDWINSFLTAVVAILFSNNLNKTMQWSLLSILFTLILILSCCNSKMEYNQRLPGACNRSPGSKLLSITTQLHCGGHHGGRAQLPDTILEEDHPMTIPSKFGFNWATGSRQDGFYVNFL